MLNGHVRLLEFDRFAHMVLPCQRACLEGWRSEGAADHSIVMARGLLRLILALGGCKRRLFWKETAIALPQSSILCS